MTPSEPNGGTAVGGGVAAAGRTGPGPRTRPTPFTFRRIDFLTAMSRDGMTDVQAQRLEPLNDVEEVGNMGLQGHLGVFV